MKKRYKHILFDLDHTLWDFEKNSAETILELYGTYRLQKIGGFSGEEFLSKFREVNRELWSKYDKNEITKEYLRDERFKIVLQELGVINDEKALEISSDYLRICPAKEHVIPFAYEILEYLKGQYQMHIITNGFNDVQQKKLFHSGLRDYFMNIITSEDAGHKKPNRGIFEYAMEVIGANQDECVMVGDNIETDIRGALSVSMDIIFFNPDRIPHAEKVTYEIFSLKELKVLL